MSDEHSPPHTNWHKDTAFYWIYKHLALKIIAQLIGEDPAPPNKAQAPSRTLALDLSQAPKAPQDPSLPQHITHKTL